MSRCAHAQASLNGASALNVRPRAGPIPEAARSRIEKGRTQKVGPTFHVKHSRAMGLTLALKSLHSFAPSRPATAVMPAKVTAPDQRCVFPSTPIPEGGRACVPKRRGSYGRRLLRSFAPAVRSSENASIHQPVVRGEISEPGFRGTPELGLVNANRP